jgi:integrase
MNIGTLRKILVTFGQILCHAVRNKYLENNPVREAERPKPQALFQEEEPVGYGSILITGFLEQVEEPKYRTLFMLAFFSGARQGELLGLKWGDVDWKNSQILIQRT